LANIRRFLQERDKGWVMKREGDGLIFDPKPRWRIFGSRAVARFWGLQKMSKLSQAPCSLEMTGGLT